MKVLYVCHRVPYPPRYGSQVRSFHVIRHLHNKGHKVTVATLLRSQQEANEALGLYRHCAHQLFAQLSFSRAWLRSLAFLPTSRPSSEGYFYSPRLQRLIDQAIAHMRYDLIVVHSSSVARYVENIMDAPKILDFTDMDSQKWLSYTKFRRFPLSCGYRIEGIKLERREAALSQKFTLCTCATQAELATLMSYGTARAADWFPNGVDTEYFRTSDQPYEPTTISFVGRMDYYPNQIGVIVFCRTILPLLKARCPRIKLVIVGAHPPRSVRALAKIPGVTVTGFVHDIRPYVHASAATIAPLQIARGTQNKVLESMAMGVPSVVSEQVAGGVDAIPGEHLLIARDANDFSEAILSIIKNPRERERLARAARERVVTHHTWQRAMERLDQIISCCLGRGFGSRP